MMPIVSYCFKRKNFMCVGVEISGVEKKNKYLVISGRIQQNSLKLQMVEMKQMEQQSIFHQASLFVFCFVLFSWKLVSTQKHTQISFLFVSIYHFNGLKLIKSSYIPLATGSTLSFSIKGAEKTQTNDKKRSKVTKKVINIGQVVVI